MAALEKPPTFADSIKVTANAIKKIYSLMQEEDNLNLKLRIFITGGGCSGFQYGFSFEETANADDAVIAKMLTQASDYQSTDIENKTDEEAAITILVDMMSLQYLTGAEIDYRKDIHGEQFIIRNNPNAKTTCGCGSSFAADAPEE